MQRGTSPQVRYLRRFVPYIHCRFDPTLSPQQSTIYGVTKARKAEVTSLATSTWPPVRSSTFVTADKLSQC